MTFRSPLIAAAAALALGASFVPPEQRLADIRRARRPSRQPKPKRKFKGSKAAKKAHRRKRR